MITPKRALTFGASAVAFVLLLIFLMTSLVNQDAKEYVVIQKLDGELIAQTEPGYHWQGFGKIKRYPRRDQFSFSSVKDQGRSIDESIQTRFNDGGHGNISGTVNWAMPATPEQIIRLHKDYGSAEAIEQQLIRVALQKVIYNVGPTMSSTESSAEKRPDIPKYIDDQLVNGAYMTKTIQQIVKDPITGQDKQQAIVTIALDDHGKPLRESESQITAYGVLLQPVAINDIRYDDAVENQIKERQKATTGVQISIANAKKAEQEAITIAKQGEATAAKAKWDQETINAKEIAEAEKELKVQTLAAQRAEQYKKQQILEGEGDAAKKKLVMEANGALDQKLEAYIKVNTQYAEAIKSAAPGAWTPAVVMGQGAQGTGAGSSALIDMFTAKTARDLGIDLGVQGKSSTIKK